MRSVNWKLANQLLEQALEQEPENMETWLDQACGDRPELRSLLGGLLSQKDGMDGFLESPPTPGPSVPKKVGPYTIETPLGAGGMAVVYLARREDDFERLVAVKIMNSGIGDDLARRRFLQERQILARLDHPNIVRLLDGGLTGDGTPWFAMDHVVGEPVDQWCDNARLDIASRIERFLRICDAVSLAHGHLVIHRDLKPANILVDERGEPRLLDFGIAAVVDPDTGAQNTATHILRRAMTPEYASPEQIRGEPLSASTDVYALGVLLYKLLCGHAPYHVSREDLASMVAVVCNKTPPKPSSWSSHGDQMAAADRGVSGKRLQKQLQGDLDGIVLKALAKNPRERYGSVEALANDLSRYLVGKPVSVRSQTWIYGLQKAVKRHKKSLSAACAFVLLLCSSTAFSIYQQQQTALERDRAQRERDMADKVTAFLEEAFQAGDPKQSLGTPPTAVTLLKQASQRLDHQDLHPSTRARLLTVMGGAWLGLGEHNQAQSMLEEAMAWYQNRNETKPLIRVLLKRAALHIEEGEYQEAANVGREALALQQQFHPDMLATGEECRTILADCLRRGGRYEEAKQVSDDLVKGRTERLGPDHPKVADALQQSGLLKWSQGQIQEAEKLLSKALEIRETTLPENHPDLANSYNNIANLYASQAKYQQALAIYSKCLKVLVVIHGDSHPSIAQVNNNLGILYWKNKDYPKARDLFNQAYAMRLELLGPHHPKIAETLGCLANVEREDGDLAEAERLFRKSLKIQKQAFPNGHQRIANNYYNLANTVLDRGDVETSQSLYRQAIQMGIQTRGEHHPNQVFFYNGLANNLLENGQYGEARCWFDQAMILRENLFGSDYPDLALCMKHMGVTAGRDQRWEDGIRWMHQALAHHEATLGTDHPDYAAFLTELAIIYRDSGRSQEALTLASKAAHDLAQSSGPNHYLTAEARLVEGSCLALLGKVDAAEVILNEARDVFLIRSPHATNLREAEAYLKKLELPEAQLHLSGGMIIKVKGEKRIFH